MILMASILVNAPEPVERTAICMIRYYACLPPRFTHELAQPPIAPTRLFLQ